MAAKIVCNVTPGSVEVALGGAVPLSNFDNTGVLGWAWTLKDKPLGSAAALTSANTAASGITPDLPGSYVIELRTFKDAARQVFDSADLQEVRCRYVDGFPWAFPGAGETTQFDVLVGWKKELNSILTDVHDYMLRATPLKTAGYSAKFGELVLVDLAGAAGNVAVSAPSGLNVSGKRIGVKIVGAASSRQAIFTPAAGTVDGSATHALTTDNAFATYQSDGTNWQRVG